MCVICQKKSGEALKCPLNMPGSGTNSQPYQSFLDNIGTFRQLDRLPVSLKFGDNVTANELNEHRAVWHKSCHVKFSSQKVQRAISKREREGSSKRSPNVEKRHRCESFMTDACLFCQEENGMLLKFKTTDANDNVKQMAVDLQDVVLLTRMEGGSNMFALILKYHPECLTAIRNRHRSFKRQNKQGSSARLDDNKIDARAFVELITHIENCVNDGVFYFKFFKLQQLFESRLCAFGIQKEINKVRFKNKILEYFSDAQEQDDGRNKVLVFQPGMRDMLKQAMKCDNEGDALVVAKATKIIRRQS